MSICFNRLKLNVINILIELLRVVSTEFIWISFPPADYTRQQLPEHYKTKRMNIKTVNLFSTQLIDSRSTSTFNSRIGLKKDCQLKSVVTQNGIFF